jgi:meso-butanediol dehydrogenase/(S,S)-butanediol dehydrogenase/diacetyl reductase
MDAAVRGRAAGRAEDKVAIVTGAGTPPEGDPVTIGHAIASVLAAAGATVVVLDRDAEAATRSVDRIRERGDHAEAEVAELTDADACSAAVERVVGRHGRVDVLVNNAAVLGTDFAIDADDIEAWATLDVNVFGAIRMLRSCLPHLTRGASVVNIGSLGGRRDYGMLGYSASKRALVAASATLAVQHGPAGIRINTVSPGPVWTQLNERGLRDRGLDENAIDERRRRNAASVPLGIEGGGWDVATVVLWFASDDSSWVTGQELLVDGGASVAGRP